MAWGSTVYTLISLFGCIFGGETFLSTTPNQVIIQIIASIIVGIGFVVPTIIYDCDNLSRPLQIIIHMGIGMIVYIICAFSVGWIPTALGIWATIFTILCGVIVSFVIWFCFYQFFKHQAKKINAKLKDKQ